GYVQGGFLAAMLDDVMGPAAYIMGRGKVFTPTIDMAVSFLSPAKAGRLVGEGQVAQLGKSIGFLEGKLWDAAGVMVAKATATCRLVESGKMLS
ncbi:MAG TPA: PaaI family thioesterase, partial [Caulobacter sp.]|nr:PaaI family thioesterase [Caulobacter sp.]